MGDNTGDGSKKDFVWISDKKWVKFGENEDKQLSHYKERQPLIELDETFYEEIQQWCRVHQATQNGAGKLYAPFIKFFDKICVKPCHDCEETLDEYETPIPYPNCKGCEGVGQPGSSELFDTYYNWCIAHHKKKYALNKAKVQKRFKQALEMTPVTELLVENQPLLEETLVQWAYEALESEAFESDTTTIERSMRMAL